MKELTNPWPSPGATQLGPATTQRCRNLKSQRATLRCPAATLRCCILKSLRATLRCPAATLRCRATTLRCRKTFNNQTGKPPSYKRSKSSSPQEIGNRKASYQKESSKQGPNTSTASPRKGRTASATSVKGIWKIGKKYQNLPKAKTQNHRPRQPKGPKAHYCTVQHREILPGRQENPKWPRAHEM